MSDPASLQNLHPIIQPSAAGLWPLAPGWYLLAAILFAICIYLLIVRHRKQLANRYRKEACNRLAVLRTQLHDRNMKVIRELPVLMKTTALHVYSRQKIAGLYGDDWLAFLDSTIQSEQFRTGPGKLLPIFAYAPLEELATLPAAEIGQCFDLVELWLKKHETPERGSSR